MSSPKNRRRYTDEFKREAVQLARKREGKITEAATNLGIHPNVLHRSIKEFQDDPVNSFPGNGNLKAPDEQLCQIKRKLRDTEEERDILKKALAIFSKQQP